MKGEIVWIAIMIHHGRPRRLGDAEGWGIPAILTVAGIEAVEKFVTRNEGFFAENKCLLATSPVPRATETAVIIADRLGMKSFGTEQILWRPGLWTPAPEKYTSFSAETLAQQNPEFAQEEGNRMLDEIFALASGHLLSDGRAILAISHGGPLDFCLAAARQNLGDTQFFSVPQNLDYCQGFILGLSADGLVFVCELGTTQSIEDALLLPALKSKVV